MAGGLSVQRPWALALSACAVGAGLYVARARRAAVTSAAPTSAIAVASSASAALPSPSPTPVPKWPFEDPASTPRVVPFQSPEAEEEQRIRNLPPQLRRAERSKRDPTVRRLPRYPADCRPASEALHRVLPHHVPPMVRPLAPTPMELGHALLRATQDRDHLLPGESATLTLEVAVDGRRTPFDVKGAELLQPGPPGVRAESLASVTFRDDGVSPDKAAHDGIATAHVSTPPRLHQFDGELRVRADVSTPTETGEVWFPLFMTSARPAVFTGGIREAVENGSLAFYAGIRVDRAGRYVFVGRVYDSDRRAMAVLTANANLKPSPQEVRLTFCGKLLRDEAIAGPWELRDLEGFHFVETKERAEMIPIPMWSGPHRTRTYPLETFSDGPAEKAEPSAP